MTLQFYASGPHPTKRLCYRCTRLTSEIYGRGSGGAAVDPASPSTRPPVTLTGATGKADHKRGIDLDKQRSITVQSTSYLASTKGIMTDLIWGGFSRLFSKEGAFFLRCKGSGTVLINAYGAIEKREIDGKIRVDSGHVVAFEGNLTHSIRRVGGWKSTLFSGEGLVLEFSGQGTLWLQTRNMAGLIPWITPSLPG